MKGRKRMGRIYRARNGVVEEVRFTVSETAKPRARKQLRSTPRKQEQNRNQAAHVLGRILNNNFEQGDLFLTLEFSTKERKALEQRARERVLREREKNCKRVSREELADAMLAEVDRDATLFLRRCKAAGASGLRYVVVPSDRDGSSGKAAAPHLHLVLSGEHCAVTKKQMTLCGRTVAELWGKGTVEYEFLRAGAYNKLAAYLIRQTRTIGNRKKYRTSRSIERIILEEFEIDADAGGEIRVPDGAEVMERQDNVESKYHLQYVRYIEPKRQAVTGHSRPRKERR